MNIVAWEYWSDSDFLISEQEDQEGKKHWFDLGSLQRSRLEFGIEQLHCASEGRGDIILKSLTF